MKTMIGMMAVMVLVVAIFALLGLAEANHMLIFGLLLAMFSGLVTIALAAAAKVKSLGATFEPTAAVAEYKSSTLTNITGLHNYSSPEDRELASLRQDLRALQDDHARTFYELGNLKTHMRLCFDNIRDHEEITLPRALAGQAGAIILATLLTLVGTALCALPDDAFLLAKACSAWLTAS